MEDNPFSALAAAFGSREATLQMYEGAIIKTSPLTIRVEGIEVSGAELLVNASMLKQTASIEMPGETVTADITPELNAGDRVLMLTTNVQVFYVLCKVVSA